MLEQRLRLKFSIWLIPLQHSKPRKLSYNEFLLAMEFRQSHELEETKETLWLNQLVGSSALPVCCLLPLTCSCFGVAALKRQVTTTRSSSVEVFKLSYVERLPWTFPWTSSFLVFNHPLDCIVLVDFKVLYSCFISFDVLITHPLHSASREEIEISKKTNRSSASRVSLIVAFLS